MTNRETRKKDEFHHMGRATHGHFGALNGILTKPPIPAKRLLRFPKFSGIMAPAFDTESDLSRCAAVRRTLACVEHNGTGNKCAFCDGAPALGRVIRAALHEVCRRLPETKTRQNKIVPLISSI